jgi:hypothetical protein
MARSHERSPSPSSSDSLLKRIKITHTSPEPEGANLLAQFADAVLDAANIHKLHINYIESEPFKYAVIDALFQDNLLQNVKNDCMNLSFSEKETDIYKVRRQNNLSKYREFTKKTRSVKPVI